jgi:uncharacterized protein
VARPPISKLLITLIAALLALAALGSVRPAASQAPLRVLMVTATAGFRHDSIPTAQVIVQQLGRQSGAFEVTLLADLPDLSQLDAALLARHQVLLFVNTSGELPLEPGQQQALLDFVAGGGGFVATHSATDTFYTWPAYAELVGATFREHPWSGAATVRLEDAQHPINLGLPASFEIADEFYVFRTNTSPRLRSHVLLSLDSASVGAAGDYPLAWCSQYGTGRTYYNALGHPASTWLDSRFQQQLYQALLWTAGQSTGDCQPG